jgi:hypothetical protein
MSKTAPLMNILRDAIARARTPDRTPVVPAPNRWFQDPAKNPGPQKMIERTVQQSGRPREEFRSGAYIDPRTGMVLDGSVLDQVIVGIDPETGRPVMSGLLGEGLVLPQGRDAGPQTLSNLVRRSLYEPVGGADVLGDMPFIATIEKSGPGHVYGLSTEYLTPTQLYNNQGLTNPTLRPKSRGDIYGMGEIVGQMQMKGRDKVHDVFEKLMVVPRGQAVDGGKYLGGAMPFGLLMGDEE